jgi:hypothetical protein
MGLHLAAFVFWAVANVATVYQLNKHFAEKEAELEATYEDATETLRANIKNVQKLAHEYNQAYYNTAFGGRNEG